MNSLKFNFVYYLEGLLYFTMIYILFITRIFAFFAKTIFFYVQAIIQNLFETFLYSKLNCSMDLLVNYFLNFTPYYSLINLNYFKFE